MIEMTDERKTDVRYEIIYNIPKTDDESERLYGINLKTLVCNAIHQMDMKTIMNK